MPSLKELLCLFPLTQRLTIPSKPKADLLGAQVRTCFAPWTLSFILFLFLTYSFYFE